jgi:hypothetical protein
MMAIHYSSAAGYDAAIHLNQQAGLDTRGNGIFDPPHYTRLIPLIKADLSSEKLRKMVGLHSFAANVSFFYRCSGAFPATLFVNHWRPFSVIIITRRENAAACGTMPAYVRRLGSGIVRQVRRKSVLRIAKPDAKKR